MLLPPPQFEQLKALAWSAPLAAAMGVGLSAHAHGPELTAQLVWGLMLAAALCAGLLAQLAIWRSQWGTRHQWVCVCATVILFVVPWSIMPLPYAAPSHPFAASGIVVVSHLVLLLSSALWHARRASPPSATASVDWPGCRIDGPKAMIRRRVHTPENGSGGRLIEPIWIGGLSVAVYHLLKAHLSGDAMMLVVVAIAWALGAWLCWGPLGRALGHCWLLMKLEREANISFRCGEVQPFQALRMRSRWGRMWTRP